MCLSHLVCTQQVLGMYLSHLVSTQYVPLTFGMYLVCTSHTQYVLGMYLVGTLTFSIYLVCVSNTQYVPLPLSMCLSHLVCPQYMPLTLSMYLVCASHTRGQSSRHHCARAKQWRLLGGHGETHHSSQPYLICPGSPQENIVEVILYFTAVDTKDQGSQSNAVSMIQSYFLTLIGGIEASRGFYPLLKFVGLPNYFKLSLNCFPFLVCQ